MAGGVALNILSQIQALVSDKLQVVSYKWLSRNFSVSSNNAKRLLQEFVDKYGNELEVIYTLSGWLKNNPQTYCIRLASGHNVTEIKQEFKDKCSVQVYSVQACIPKDLAVLWSAEFVQAEEYFNQPSTAENCFRDNRFCGVSNTFVKRIVDGKPVALAPSQPKNCSKVTVESKTSELLVQPPQQGHVNQSNKEKVVQSCAATATADKFNMVAPKINNKPNKPHVVKESASTVHATKQKNQNEKASSVGSGGSIASLWGHASLKSKPVNLSKDSDNVPDVAITAEAQIRARESADAVSSDDDEHDLKELRGTRGRKRRVFMDFSDDENEEEKVVSLESPDPPNGKPVPNSLQNSLNSVPEKRTLNFGEVKGEPLDDTKDSTVSRTCGLSSEEDARAESKNRTAESSSREKGGSSIPEVSINTNQKDKTTDSASTSPKRRKVVKTRIDERGREVNEVVWEGEATGSVINTVDNTTGDAGNSRAPVATKAAPTGSSNPAPSKAGNKKPAKGGAKDPKQGNIMSFFKKV